MRRALMTALMSLVLIAAVAAPASAATVKRTWWTNLGSGGANGRITLQGYMGGTGSMAVVMKALRAHATYSIRVRAGESARASATCCTTGATSGRMGRVPRRRAGRSPSVP